MIENRKIGPISMLIMFVALLPGEVHAYIGPGAGLSAIGSFLAVVAAILLGLVGFVWYPVKRLLRRKKKTLVEDGSETPTETSIEADEDRE